MIRILVDSSSDYMLDELKEKNIDLIPLTVTLGEKSYLDGIDLDRNDFFKLLESGTDFPKTSQAPPQTFLDVFEDVKEKGDDMICILLSSELSGTYQSAMLAKDMVGYDNIDIIDSLSATYTVKVMADYAYSLRKQGIPAKDIAEKIENLKSRCKVVAALNTLEYLHRGGRLGKAAAIIGEMVNLKPIITLTEKGTIGILGKCIGKNKAVRFILNHLDSVDIDTDFPIYTIYSYGTDNVEVFENKLALQNYAITDRLQIGATIGSHIGPEAFGIIFVTKE